MSEPEQNEVGRTATAPDEPAQVGPSREMPSTAEERVIRLAAYALGSVAGVSLFAMMVLTFADVIGRYIFNWPVPGAYEFISFMMGVLIFTALPLLCFKEEHVTIDLLDSILPRSSKRFQQIIVNLLSAVVLLAMGWRLYLVSIDYGANNEVTMTMKIPFQPFALLFAVMAAAAALACLVIMWSYLRGNRDANRAGFS
jgi:TRAP-type C4-dicarboxylate transport system permease small subunit